MNELTGSVALVTGGSRGIGAAIAKQLARDGATVGLTYVNAGESAEAVAREIEAEGGRALTIRADSADADAIVAAVEQTVSELGRIDVLVNNAGIFSGGPFADTTLAELDRILAIDVRAVFLASQAAAQHMTDGGRIINIGSSLAERVPGPTLTLYSMAKAALLGLTKGLARDLSSQGINVSVVQPGPIDTEMNPQDGPAAEFLNQVTALGRYGTVDDVAAAVSYLAGTGGRYITGSSITVDGGMAA